MATVQIKRIYAPRDDADGKRILVDRLWPRGVKKETAHLDDWMKDIAPSTELRKWFDHNVAVWQGFEARYMLELKQNATAVNKLLDIVKANHTVTLLYAAHDEAHNHAVVLLHFINSVLAK